MPIYEFECETNHDHLTEHLVKQSVVLVSCSICGSSARKIISAPYGVVIGSSTPCRSKTYKTGQ